MKIAIVYDRVNKFGGAERILLNLHKLWPEAPIFTAVYYPENASWARGIRIKPSFLNRIPGAPAHHELFPWLTPLAFEQFSFDEYDCVISVTSAEAKTIITKPQTLHVCYCLTPTRYLWSGFSDYQNYPGMGEGNTVVKAFHSLMTPRLRVWDMIGSQRPDRYLAISQRVKDRIIQYYHREVDQVIYPPVATDQFIVSRFPRDDGYFLVVSRLVGYKRIDLIVQTFNDLGLPLKVIGSGVGYRTLRSQAHANIEFIDSKLTDDELARYYQNCRAFIFAADEDFGIVAGEAQACGKPVIAFKDSGIGEIIVNKKTGILYPEQTVESLKIALKSFGEYSFDPLVIRKNVERFDSLVFQRTFLQYTERSIAAHQKNL